MAPGMKADDLHLEVGPSAGTLQATSATRSLAAARSLPSLSKGLHMRQVRKNNNLGMTLTSTRRACETHPPLKENNVCSYSLILQSALRTLWENWGLSDLRGRCFCELGCGNGSYVLDVCKAFPAYRCIGFDADTKLVAEAAGKAELSGLCQRCTFHMYDENSANLSGVNAVLLSSGVSNLASVIEPVLANSNLQPGSIILTMGRELPPTRHAVELLQFQGHGAAEACLFSYVWRAASQIAEIDTTCKFCDVKLVVPCDMIAPPESNAADEEINANVFRVSSAPCMRRSRSAPLKPLPRRETQAALRLPPVPCRRAARETQATLEAQRILQSPIRVKPRQVFFSNATIASRFSCGRDVRDTINELREGTLRADDIPRITVVRRGERLVTLNHRRLYAFQHGLPDDAEIDVQLVHRDSHVHIAPDCRGQRSVHVDSTMHRSADWENPRM